MSHEDHDQMPLLGEHTPRFDWMSLAPDVFKALVRLDTVARRDLPETLVNLIKVRSSQINHCAFCLDMHSKDALAAGDSMERVVQLSAWQESRHFYTAREIAAIELTESVTVLTDGFVPDEVYERAAQVFEPAELAQIISVIVAINAFNRFGVASRMVPGHYVAGAAH
jgi:AhpD family alkylhydroperoxidase